MDLPSRVIYVGSIPYDQTEEQILDIFKTVGPVANIRLVFDKESGKSKGFAFVEYVDPGSAASAVRNLNNYQIGSRNLKVDFSRETSVSSPGPNQLSFPSSSTPASLASPSLSGIGPSSSSLSATSAGLSSLQIGQGSSSSYSDLIASLPQGTMPPPGVAAHNAINKTLMTLTRDQMLEIIMDLKTLSQKNPKLTSELFSAAPQLSYMAIQSMLMLNLVDDRMVFFLAGQQPQPQLQPQQQQQQSQPQSQSQQQSQSQPQQQQQQQPQMPLSQPPTQPSQYEPQPKQTNTSLNTSPPQPEKQEQEIELIRKVMELTDEQIAQLSKDQRDALNVLREKVRSGEYQL